MAALIAVYSVTPIVLVAPAAAAAIWSVSHDISAVPALRMSATVRFCLAFWSASRKFGISSAAMMPMIATTISSSIRVNPRCRLRSLLSMNTSHRRPTVDSVRFCGGVTSTDHASRQ